MEDQPKLRITQRFGNRWERGPQWDTTLGYATILGTHTGVFLNRGTRVAKMRALYRDITVAPVEGETVDARNQRDSGISVLVITRRNCRAFVQNPAKFTPCHVVVVGKKAFLPTLNWGGFCFWGTTLKKKQEF